MPSSELIDLIQRIDSAYRQWTGCGLPGRRPLLPTSIFSGCTNRRRTACWLTEAAWTRFLSTPIIVRSSVSVIPSMNLLHCLRD